MVDKKITELTELTVPESADVVAIVDDPAGAPETKKITYANLESNLSITAIQVSDFDTEVSNNSSVTTNTAKTGITAQQATDITTNNAKVTNVSTDLSEGTSSETTVNINSSDGTNATMVSASTLRAGLLTKVKFDEIVVNTAKISYTDASAVSSNTTHRGLTNDPHSVTATQVGLGNVSNVATDDTAYNATSWNTNSDSATKNAIRDKVETMDTAIGSNTTHRGSDGSDHSDVVTNSSKVTNATHTGDVTGSTSLTLDKTAVTGQSTVTAIGADYVLISDTGDTGNLKKALISDFASAGGDMAAATYDPTTIAADTFAMDNMVEGATTKILTSTERTAITNNTAKVTNATHTGDVTGNTALTIATDAVDISMLSATGTPGATTFLRGDNTWTTPSGSGDVSKVGTPIDNQVGVWTGDGTIEGTTGLTYNGTAFDITGNITLSGTVDGIDIATDVAANTSKVTNVSTNLSAGTLTATTIDVNSSDGTNATLVEADTTNAGILGSDKWDEIVANTSKVTNVSTNLSEGTSTTTTVDVNSSDGTNATLVAASTSRAGVLTKAKFDEIVVNNAKTGVTTEISNVVEDTTPQLGGNLDLNQNSVELDPTPTSDHTWNGEIINATAAENLVIGDVCYLNSAGKFAKIDADAEATTKGFIAMSTGTISTDSTGIFLLNGFIRDDTWTWTIGDELWAPLTPGNPSATKPSATGDIVRLMGYAYSADIIYFNPDKTYIEVV